MKLYTVIVLIGSFFLEFTSSDQIAIAQETAVSESIENILELPEKEIDLGKACLVLAKDAYPNLHIERFDYVLDYMASQIKRLVQGKKDPEVRIGAMNTYLYRKGWWNDLLSFTYDLENLEANKKHNQFLNGYLSTRKGSCITMPMLHLVLADRLGWPIRAVRSPKHFFARYIEDGFAENNIEATSGGGYISNRQYMEDVVSRKRQLKTEYIFAAFPRKSTWRRC